jgi:hypothetical protein
MKQSVRPSAIHSMAMIFLLSPEIVPKPETTDLVGIRWAMPHSVITIEPMDTNTYLVIISVPPWCFAGVGGSIEKQCIRDCPRSQWEFNKYPFPMQTE